MSTGEIWRLVPSVPAVLASSLGRVMRVPHVVEMHHGGKRQYGGRPTYGVLRKREESLPESQPRRFFTVYEFGGGGTKQLMVHRLVCEAFHGPPPEGMDLCLHVDENSDNNRPENLKWGTQKENLSAPGYREFHQKRCQTDIYKRYNLGCHKKDRLSKEDVKRIKRNGL